LAELLQRLLPIWCAPHAAGVLLPCVSLKDTRSVCWQMSCLP
jgi:hypothetical protein